MDIAHEIRERARRAQNRIVLPEGDDPASAKLPPSSHRLGSSSRCSSAQAAQAARPMGSN